jgi:hypothetical protein
LLPIYNKQQVPHSQLFRGKTKESSKQKGSYIIFKEKPECFQYLFFLHDLNGRKLNTPPPPILRVQKLPLLKPTPSLNYRKTKGKNPTESEYPKPSEDDNNNNKCKQKIKKLNE